jgi:two-component system, cell cycle response regulator DivK
MVIREIAMEAARSQPAQRPPVVFIVDDDRDTREMYALALTWEGFHTVPLGNAGEAYQRAWETQPDAIVTDLSLPSTDGWELIRRLQGDPATQPIPIVVLTGHAAPAVRQRALDAGCAALLVKPCMPEELATELRHVLQGGSL